MPIYEFRCKQCDKRFSRLCELGETGTNLTCPTCQAPGPARVMSGFIANNPGGLQGSRGDSCTGCTSSNCNACKH